MNYNIYLCESLLIISILPVVIIFTSPTIYSVKASSVHQWGIHPNEVRATKIKAGF